MTDLSALKKILRDEYGINDNDELNKALMKMRKLDIGVFTAPIDRGNTHRR